MAEHGSVVVSALASGVKSTTCSLIPTEWEIFWAWTCSINVRCVINPCPAEPGYTHPLQALKKPTDLDLHCLSLSMLICINNLGQEIWLAENFWSGCGILIYSACQGLIPWTILRIQTLTSWRKYKHRQVTSAKPLKKQYLPVQVKNIKLLWCLYKSVVWSWN